MTAHYIVKNNSRILVSLVGSNSVTLATANGNGLTSESVSAMSIAKVIGSGSWAIDRGATRIMNLNGNFNFNYEVDGTLQSQFANTDITATLVTGNGTLLLDIRKTSNASINGY